MSNGAILDRRRVLGAISDQRRVLTKFQINLVIPKKQYLWLYFNQGRVGICIYMGIFINNMGKGKKRGVYIIELKRLM